MFKILFILESIDPSSGGVAQVSYILSKGFMQKGHDIYFLYSNKDCCLISNSHKLKFDENENSNILIRLFENYILRNNIKIVICQNHHSKKFQSIYKYLKISCNVKIITCLHSNPDIWVNKNKFYNTLFSIYFKELIRSFCFYFINPYKNRMVGMYNISDKYILLSLSYIPIFMNIYELNYNSKLVSISNPLIKTNVTIDFYKKKNIVLVVSRMAEQQKRISNILKIWKNIHNNFMDWELVLVGDGPDLLLYERISKKFKLKNIKFVGHSNEVENYYKISKIFLMTSVWEGLPMTLLEALANGCVPLAYENFAAIHDIIESKFNGYIIPNNNDDFINTLSDLMYDQKKLMLLSKNSELGNSQKFNIGNILNKWNLLFDDLV